MKTKFEKKYTDQELCLLIQQKNKAGFDKLYDQYSYMVYGLASKTIRSKECAEEIAELTFLNIWNSIHVFQNQKKNLCLWIVSILITTAKDYLESKNIKYSINTENFPDFAFDILEEEAC
jgi:DNA-directed RNA polymerase specialized sigma24 family protein